MASIHREILVDVPPTTLWDAMRDPGALHTRLAPAFVSECTMDGNEARELRFANGMTVRELIIDIDDDRRRIAWSAVGGRLTHHNASTQSWTRATRAAASSGSPTCCPTHWHRPSPA